MTTNHILAASMDEFFEQLKTGLTIVLLTTPGAIACFVHDYLKNKKLVFFGVVLGAPISYFIFTQTTDGSYTGIDYVGLIFAGIIALPLIYLVTAPLTYLTLAAGYYLYQKHIA